MGDTVCPGDVCTNMGTTGGVRIESTDVFLGMLAGWVGRGGVGKSPTSEVTDAVLAADRAEVSEDILSSRPCPRDNGEVYMLPFNWLGGTMCS